MINFKEQNEWNAEHSTVWKEIVSRFGQEAYDDEATRATQQATLHAEYDNAQYARDREQAYPPMADQLDDIFHNGVDGWKATIQAVKDTYPKPV
jgi:hypothetical protein